MAKRPEIKQGKPPTSCRKSFLFSLGYKEALLSMRVYAKPQKNSISTCSVLKSVFQGA